MTPVDLTAMGVEVTVRFNQRPEAVWALLTDVERMAGLGPEHFRARWLTSGPAVGARFEGWNRIGEREWDVTCVVTACRPAQIHRVERGRRATPLVDLVIQTHPGR